MTQPTYFRNFPNINYSLKTNKAGIVESISIKDYFHLLVPRDDIFKDETLYEDYIVENGARPDQISYELYEDEQYYWILLQINEITDYYNQWPMSQLQLDDFILRKYGGIEETEKINYYETRDVFDDDGNLILPGGMRVPGDFNFRYPLRPGSAAFGFANLASGGVIAVSNREFEYDLNFNKSRIQILKREYIGQYIREVNNFGAFLRRGSNSGNINSSTDLGDLR